MKSPTTYIWWDIWEDAVIVQSDSDRYPVLGMFPISGDADSAIQAAERHIAEMRAGRLTLKAAATTPPAPAAGANERSE